jgi:hypothetical protein
VLVLGPAYNRSLGTLPPALRELTTGAAFNRALSVLPKTLKVRLFVTIHMCARGVYAPAIVPSELCLPS